MKHEPTGTPSHTSAVSPAADHSASITATFGQHLLNQGLITAAQLERALEHQRLEGGRLGEILVAAGVLVEDQMLRALAEHLHMDYWTLDDLTQIDAGLARQLPEGIARRFCVLPVGQADQRIRIVMADPVDVMAIDTVMLRLQRRIQPTLCPRRRIVEAIEAVYHGSEVEEARLRELVREEDQEADLVAEMASLSQLVDPAVDGDVNDAPVVRFVDLLLRQAVKSQASDIHIEPEEEGMTIRMRVDGKLRDMVPPPRKMQAAVVARLKILSQLNIAERRLPQDGRLKVTVSQRDIDVRVSVVPTIYGEKVVLRILDHAATCHDLDQLGFSPEKLAEFKEALALPHGIVMVTGPTGSGKTTTLYAALNHLKDPAENITTVEDPVEYRLSGINQIQIKPEIGLDFATCLRAILRQDPDIILIGEIRDRETVDIAIKASLTGHLVLSTFHTNDAASAVSRLAYMGIERYLLASTLNLVVAQRLVRRICEKCKEPAQVPPAVLRRLGLRPEQATAGQICYGRGCGACGGTGYKGRMPIFEFLRVDDSIRPLILGDVDEDRIRQAGYRQGGGSLLDSGLERVLRGETTVEEVMSVAYTGRASARK